MSRRGAVGALLLCAHGPLAAVDFERCVLTAVGERAEAAAECATLEVPLDPGNPDGERIKLFVARISALAGTPEPDPFTLIAGGPGQASTTFYAQTKPAFARIRRTRDIVLVDQRGTGLSTPLRCENIERDEVFLDSATFSRLGTECVDGLSHDPAFFTTSAAVRDLELMRETLGYPSLNIYGISYGTRVAQHYLKRYPEHARTVILDGVVPPSLALGPGAAIDAQRALDRLLARCARDARLRGAVSRFGGSSPGTPDAPEGVAGDDCGSASQNGCLDDVDPDRPPGRRHGAFAHVLSADGGADSDTGTRGRGRRLRATGGASADGGRGRPPRHQLWNAFRCRVYRRCSVLGPGGPGGPGGNFSGSGPD